MPDLVPKRRTQQVNAGLQGGVPWSRNSCKSICPICKFKEEDNYHLISFSVVKLWDLNLTYFGQKLFSLIETKAAFEVNVIINIFLEN